jgi:hypothetical protein
MLTKTLVILGLVLAAGCGDLTCECGDGRKFTQTYTNGNAYNYQSCALFCATGRPLAPTAATTWPPSVTAPLTTGE